MEGQRGYIGLGVVLLGACAAFDATTTPPTGADGGADETPEGGGPDVVDDTRAAEPDAGVDVVASPCADAGVDAHWLCDDFDRPNPPFVLPPWTQGTLDTGTTSVLSTEKWRSPPQALELITTGANANTELVAERTKRTMGLQCAFDVMIAGSGSGGGKARIFNLNLRSGSDLLVVELKVAESERLLEHGSHTSIDGGTNTVPAATVTSLGDSWHAIVVNATRTNYTVTVDGKSSTVTLLSPIGPFDRETATFGLALANATAPWRLWFDDIVCDAL